MNPDAVPEVSRRGFVKASAAGLASASFAGLVACGPGAARPASPSRAFADAVLEGLRNHRLVAIGAADELQEHYDALTALLFDPRVRGMVDAIVVEWGNPFYQDTIDRFVAGHPVADAELRAVWRNTTQSPVATWDGSVYEQFYRMVRAINWRLSPHRRIRVLLGDSPIDWSRITTASQLRSVPDRDAFVTSLVRRQVLDKGKRALLCYGMTGLFHDAGLTGAIERHTGKRIYVIADLVAAAGSRGGAVAARLARYRRDSVIPTAGSWLGRADASLFVNQVSRSPSGQHRNPFCGAPLAKLIDAGLYLGRPQDLTRSLPDPDIYFDPTYWQELQRRNALLGNPVDLNSYRQDHGPSYPRATPPGC